MVSIYTVRKIVSIVLLIAWIITCFTGLVLYLYTTKVLYKHVLFLSSNNIRMLHTYVSFIAFGTSILHIYLNWNAIKVYLGFVRRKK